MKKPDYDHSLLSLISSILACYGAATSHKTLTEIDALLAKNFKNVVIMLFDGMGTTILDQHLPPDSFLKKHLNGSISSVFPPTTTAATVTMETGLSPIEHAWLGWSLYFDEIGANVSIFPNTISGTNGKSAADYNVARRYIPYENVCEKIEKATDDRVKAYHISPFSAYPCKSVSEICNTVEQLCSDDDTKYIYTYWHQPDYDLHDYGTKHEKITADISAINEAVESLCQKLKDTLIIVTADHGLIDTTWHFIPDYPEIAMCQLRMPSIESRALTFFIKDGMKTQFENSFNRHFGDFYSLYTKKQVLGTVK